ncbi:hypothetical protein ABVT39_010695 [Epinephelus coioides]
MSRHCNITNQSQSCGHCNLVGLTVLSVVGQTCRLFMEFSSFQFLDKLLSERPSASGGRGTSFLLCSQQLRAELFQERATLVRSSGFKVGRLAGKQRTRSKQWGRGSRS